MQEKDLLAIRESLAEKLTAHQKATADEINGLLKLSNELQLKIQKRNNELQDEGKLIEGRIAMIDDLLGKFAKNDDSSSGSTPA